MAIVDMSKLSLIGLESDKDRILRDLMKLGVIEIIDLQQEQYGHYRENLAVGDGSVECITEIENELNRVKWAVDFLGTYGPKRKKGLFSARRTIDARAYSRVADGATRLKEVSSLLVKQNEKLNNLRNEENRLTNLIASLEPWKSFRLPLEVDETRTVRITTGTVPKSGSLEEMQRELAENVPESVIIRVSEDNDQTYVCIVFHNNLNETVNEILKKHGFSRTTFKDLTGTAEENITGSRRRIKAINEERAAVEAEIGKLSSNIEDLEAYYDHLSLEVNREKALLRMVRTNRAFVLEGWVPARLGQEVKDRLQGKWDCLVDINAPGENEEYPVLLDNPGIVRPFELVTEFYSLPNHKGIDPNAFIAPFYFIFFGMMLSDAGYGLVLSLITGIMLYKYKLEGTARKLFGLMFLCGISTFMWGVLFGGWFGNIADAVTGRENVIPPLWFAPLNDPMKLLILSFILGGIQIFTGMGIKAYSLIKDGKLSDAVFDIGSWYLVLVGLVLLVLGGTAASAGKYMALAGVAMLILTQGRNQKGIIKKFLMGLLSLYNITGYLGDVLSYSRLLALGLATGVIANVINTMGTIGGNSVFGIIILIIIFFAGHAFNLAINVLGAYVHSSRLQYVEFFGKFYEGGGKMFKPFKRVTKYINLQDGEDY